MRQTTPHDDVNGVLEMLTDGLTRLLGHQLIGLYLTGSLTYGDFDRGSSDIDVLAVLTHSLSPEQLEQVKMLHTSINRQFPVWAKRIEGSYITKDMLANTQPPKQSRPYVNAGKFWDFQYGNEWLLNLRVLHDCGIALVGPDPTDLFPSVEVEAVREAARQDLHTEWEQKLTNPAPFEHPDYDTNHLQAYAVLTMCRVLHGAKNDEVASKRVASAWVKRTYNEWIPLIEKAERWQHGKTMDAVQETLNFIRFTLDKVS